MCVCDVCERVCFASFLCVQQTQTQTQQKNFRDTERVKNHPPNKKKLQYTILKLKETLNS
jgi:hypothetical protein